jgi:hypothetical protein
MRIAIDGVKVIVWDVVSESASSAYGRRDNDGRIKLL